MYYGDIPELSVTTPTGQEDFPLVLLSGDEGAGKSYQAAAFAASPHVSKLYWLELGEGSPHSYLKHFDPSGEKAFILNHDGTWSSQMGQIMAVRERVARPAFKKGELPVVLVIDSNTLQWEQIKNWVDFRARNNKENRKRLAADPDAELIRPRNLWNDADHRWTTMMTALTTFPGIVVITCRGKMVSATDDNGNPVAGSQVYKVQSNKSIGNDASVHVRLSVDEPPVVLKCKTLSPAVMVRPGTDKPKRFPDFTLEDLIFTKMGCDPRGMQIRDVHEPVPVDEEDYRRVTPTPARPDAAPPTDPGVRVEKGYAALRALAEQAGWETAEVAADFADWTQGAQKLGALPPTDESVGLLQEFYKLKAQQAAKEKALRDTEHAQAGGNAA